MVARGRDRAPRSIRWIISALLAVACDDPPAHPPVGVDAGPIDAAAGRRVPLPETCGQAYCAATLPSWGTVVATGDVNGDGRPDILLGAIGPYLRDAGPLVLLRNDGASGFIDITTAAGLAGWGAWFASFGDLDNDGDLDLVLGARRLDGMSLERGVETVFDNDGHGRFAMRPNAGIPAAQVGVPTAIDLVDVDEDGRLDIVTAYSGTNARLTYSSRILLARPDGGFALRDVGVNDDGFSWVVRASDFSGDGRPDLLVTHDGYATVEAPRRARDAVPCDLDPGGPGRPVTTWLNAAYTSVGGTGEPRFVPFALHERYTDPNLTPMGVAVADFNEDGRFDYLFTNVDESRLFLSTADGSYEDRSRESGFQPDPPPPADAAPGPAWSAIARDIDRDGAEDVYVTYGVLPYAGPPVSNRIFRNQGMARFSDVASGTGFDIPGRWFSLAALDIDDDGDDDLVMGEQTLLVRGCDHVERGAVLLRNDRTNAGRHWLRLRLVGTVSNRDGIGARVEVVARGVTRLREVSRNGATLATQEPTVDVGLGDATAVERVRVRWPDGYVQDLRDVPVDRLTEVREPRWLTVSATVAAADTSVSVELVGADIREPSFRLLGAARWLSPPALEPTSGAYRARFTGRGLVAVAVTAREPAIHAAPSVLFR